MASVGLMHNLSKMMVMPHSAGDARLSWRCQTQLEMPDSAGDASGVHMHADKIYKIYCESHVYKFMNVLVLYIIQTSSNQYINRLVGIQIDGD